VDEPQAGLVSEDVEERADRLAVAQIAAPALQAEAVMDGRLEELGEQDSWPVYGRLPAGALRR
jgi:hypothetical protein